MSEDLKRARELAIGVLARREHSRKELSRKLRARGFDSDIIHSVLEELALKGLQCDIRYTESYLHNRIQKGYGPVRLRQELRERGIQEEVIDDCIDNLEIDWIQQLKDVRIKKFGTVKPVDFKERTKESRFLQYRGFTSDQIRTIYRQ